MSLRSIVLRLLACGAAAVAVLVGPALAEELLGVLTKVDIDAKQVTIVTKDDKEVVVKVTDDTEYVAGKKSAKIDLERVSKSVERIKEKGQKGLPVTVTHEGGVASKIQPKFAGKRKGAGGEGAPGKRRRGDSEK